MTANVVILQLVLLGVVLESDLGRKKVGLFRVLRPVVTVILIVPFFFTSLPTGRHDLLLQGAGVLAGALLGLFCMTPWFVRIGYDPAWRSRLFRNRPPRPKVVTRAGFGYASIWIVFTAARLWFAYGSQHEFPVALGQFLHAHQLSGDALTNAFIFMSIAMSLFRSAMLAGRAQRVRHDHAGEMGRLAPVTGPAAAGPVGFGPAAPGPVRPGPAAPGPVGPGPVGPGPDELEARRSWANGLAAGSAGLLAGRLNRAIDRPLDRAGDRQGRRQARRARRRQ